MRRLFLFVALSCAAVLPAFAIDPGTVQGSLRANDKTIPLRQAYAHLHDNAEGLLDRPKELRILFTDREVPQESLIGIAFLSVENMARDGRVQGLLLRLDPDKPDNINATLLVAPAEPGMSLVTQSLSATGQKLFKDFKFTPTRVLGAIEHRDDRARSPSEIPVMAYSIQFSAPVFNEPAVTADLKSKDAQASPQVRALIERARALARGDFAAAKKLSTERGGSHIDRMVKMLGAEATKQAREAGAEMEKQLRQVRRVVVRGERAVAILAKGAGWSTLARQGGEWKSDD